MDEINGQKLPPESQRVQQRADDLIRQAREKWTELWNLVLTQESGNQSAKADIVVDGKVILANVPVTTLLFLDKQVNDLETFVSKLPTPDPAEEWTHDPNTALLRSRATESIRTSKEPTVIVKYDATKEHPPRRNCSRRTFRSALGRRSSTAAASRRTARTQSWPECGKSRTRSSSPRSRLT